MYYDYHTHTDVSEDGYVPIDLMIDAAMRKGVIEMAVTDHYDPDYNDPDFSFSPDLSAYHDLLESTKRAYADRFNLVKGIEIGVQRGNTIEKCRTEATGFDYDFIICSFHSCWGEPIDLIDYTAMERDKILPEFYENMYECLSEFKDYDVVGHYNIIDRYLPFELDNSSSMDIIEATLKMIIADGKGIELNTSSYRYGMGERTTPSREILTLYRELGGEIITIGSDAHKIPELVFEFDKAKEILKSCGFKYQATFRSHTAKMVPL